MTADFAIAGLQWSRDLSVAETRHAGRNGHHLPEASMEPRPFSRGDKPQLILGMHEGSRFNGAATFQSRRPVVTFQPHLLDTASMEPRPFSRGDCCQTMRCWHTATGFNGAATIQSRRRLVDARYSEEFDWLQWSRDHSVAETPVFGQRLPYPLSASMEPRPFSRGETVRVLQFGLGTRPFSRLPVHCTARLPSTFTPILRVKHRH